jgi:purine-binding chemotaxis protein CheW
MPSEKQRPDPQKSLVGFVVGDVSYAVPISAVKEIVTPVALTELPHAPRAVAGVADHRGEVIPIIDLRTRFGLPRSDEPRRNKWILVEVQGKRVGLAVDRVTEVFGTGGQELKAAPALGPGDDVRGILGVTTYDGRLVFVLDVARFESLTSSLEQSGLLRAAAKEQV